MGEETAGETAGEAGPIWVGTTNRGEVQLRAPRWNAWTTARRRRFLEALAATANVAMASRASGTTPGNVRSLRYRDAGFAALWDKAIQVGRDRLEEELLSRALGQSADGVNPSDLDLDLNAPAPAPFDVELALKLLAMNRKQARTATDGRMKPATQGEMDAALMKRLVPVAHPADARFVLVEEDAVRSLDVPIAAIGRPVRALASGPGDTAGPAAAGLVPTGASVLPPAPVHLCWQEGSDGGGELRWIRRSRAGAAWVDGVDAPLAEERELYAVALTRGGATIREVEMAVPWLAVTAAERAGPPLRATVRQRGTMGLSAAADLDF